MNGIMNVDEYSLWLIPEIIAAQRLQKVIDDLAKRYKGPVFSPHVTLASPIHGHKNRLCEKVVELTEISAPIKLRALRFDSENEYYRSLYISLRQNAALEQLRSGALDYWTDLQSQTFNPHISLLYIQPGRIDLPSLLDSVDHNLLRTFVFDRLALYLSNGLPEQWRLVAEYPLVASK